MKMRERGCLLIAEEVSKNYEVPTGRKDRIAVLERVNLCVKSGQLACLLGPSGCGKSTLLNIIAGFERPTSGCVLVDNREVKGPGYDRGVVFQEDALFPWLTVRDNIGYGLVRAGNSREEITKKTHRFIQLVGLEGFSDFYPDQISGGMKQRVALARALVNAPDALLMDEPFAALDAQARGAMQNLLLEVWGAMSQTILFITHDVDEALILSDRIYVMTALPGCILEEVPVDLPRPRTVEVMATPAFFKIKRRLVTLLERAGAGKRPLNIIPACPVDSKPASISQ
ncbi:MAG: ABC transporter ATP-binding protein [Pseudomonadota bacterium]